MIPIFLTIQGLYSYRSKQVIDFRKLVSAQIFGVFGGVGSGKSSILEAISFALYNQSERLNKQDNRSYNMMNLKSDEFLIDFVFTAGSDQQEYRIKIETSRKKNKDEVKPFTRTTYKKNENDWVATELDIENLVGLSYENFKRTIIIPQGKFQEFLELKDSERVKMMKDIFQLEKFDLSDQVGVLISENKQISENVKGQMISLENVSHETIQELSVQKENTEIAYKKFQEKLKTGRQSLQDLEKLKELNDLLNAKKVQFKKLSEQELQIDQQEKTLQQYQRLYRLFQFDLVNQKQLQAQQVDIQHKISQSQLNYGQLKDKQQQALVSFEKLEADYNNRDNKLRQAEEMETYLEAKSVQAKLRLCQKEETDCRVEFESLVEAVRKAEENEDILKKQLSGLSKDRSQKDELYQIKAWFEKEKFVLKSLNDLLNEKNKNHALQIQLRNELATKLLKLDLGWKSVEEIPDNFDNFSVHIKDRIANFQQHYEQCQTEIARVNTHLKLEAYAQALQEGDPCPLCGSEHHPDILESKNSHEKLNEFQQQSSRIEEQISKLNELILQMSRQYQSLDIIQEKLIELSRRIELNQSEYDLLKAGFVWPEYKNMSLEEVDARLHKLLEIEKEEKDISVRIEKFRQQQKDHRNTLQHKQVRLQQLAQENASLVTKVETLFHSLKNLKVEKAEAMDEALIQEKVQEIRNWYQQIGQQYKTSELLLHAKVK
jgi:exonuclease SbcC